MIFFSDALKEVDFIRRNIRERKSGEKRGEGEGGGEKREEKKG